MKITKTGYRKDSPDKKEKAVIIPSNKISMKDTEHEEIYAVPYKDGKPMQMVLMKRGGEYNFEGADYVVEIPKLQGGGQYGALQYGYQQQMPNVFEGYNNFSNGQYIQNAQPLANYAQQVNTPVPPTAVSGVQTQVETPQTSQAETQPSSLYQNAFKTTNEATDGTFKSVGLKDPNAGVENNEKEGEDRYDASQPEKDKIYNPYGSFDTRSAANLLGRSIGGEANAATGVAAGAKVGFSLLRDVMSGVGTAKRNTQQEDKYKQRQREFLTNNFQQAGGSINQENIADVANATGITFSEDYGNEYFERIQPEQQISTPPRKVNLGKYEGRDFFNIQDNGSEIIASPTQKNPLTKDDYQRSLNYLREMNPEVSFARNSYVPMDERTPRNNSIGFLQKGGEINLAESLTGEYVQGMPEGKEGQGVVEVEAGEHIVQPDGTTSEVVGDKHSGGGEKLSPEQVEEGSIVISDHLKIGGENAKHFRDKFDIKVKAKDTYATVVDKVKAKIGIDKVVKEQEEVFKKIEQQEKETKDEATKDLNLQFLSGKVKELEDKKKELEPQRMEAMKEVFERQESSKPVEERAQVDPDMIATLAQQNNMDPQQAQQLIEQYLNGGTYYDVKQTGGEITYPKEQAQKIIDFSKGEYAGQFAKQYDVKVNEDGSVTMIPKEGAAPPNGYFEKSFNNLGLTPLEREKVNTVNSLTTVPTEEEGLKADASGLTKINTTNFENQGQEKTTGLDNLNLKPDQGVLPPSSIQLPTKVETRLQRADTVNMSPEAALVENQRQANALMQQVANMPPAQQAAAMAQIQTQTQNAGNQEIARYTQQNAQMDNATERFNIGQADRENMAAGQNSLSYEDRTFRTQAAYDENLMQYYDFLRNVNTQNYNDTKNENTVNSMFENYKMDSEGNLVIKTADGATFTVPRSIADPDKKKTTKKKD